jgi:hypothetical protein
MLLLRSRPGPLAQELGLDRRGAADDFRNLLGDRGLARLVVDEVQVPISLVALSLAAFIATMRAACSEATFSITAWYTSDSM